MEAGEEEEHCFFRFLLIALTGEVMSTSAKKEFYFCHLSTDKWVMLSDSLSIGSKLKICANCNQLAEKW
jgi:hypothetical protein